MVEHDEQVGGGGKCLVERLQSSHTHTSHIVVKEPIRG